MQIGVQTGLFQEALPEGLRNELYQSNVRSGELGEVQTQILKALHDGAALHDTVNLALQREVVADEQFGRLAGLNKAPVIFRDPPAQGLALQQVSADAADWDTCEWFLAGVPTSQAIFVPSFTLPGAGEFFCRFTNAFGSTDSASVVVA